jgi:hypothetical protein
MNIEDLESFLFVLESQGNMVSQMLNAYIEMRKERSVSEIAFTLLQKTKDDLLRITTEVTRLVKIAMQIQAAVIRYVHLCIGKHTLIPIT